MIRMCSALRVSRSGYYDWRSREPSERVLRRRRVERLVREIHEASYGIYGYRKVHRAILDQGLETCCADTVLSVMRDLGLQSRRVRKYVVTTDSDHDLPVADNLIDRDFSASGPNEKWLGDITYMATREGWLFLAAILDCFSRYIVGWAMSDSIDARLVYRALEMAIARRDFSVETQLIHHSDRGSQYSSGLVQRLLAEHGVEVSMSRAGDPWDNAMMESLYASLKREWILGPFETRAEGELEVFKYFEMFYNPVRLHESLNYISPQEYEERYWATKKASEFAANLSLQ